MNIVVILRAVQDPAGLSVNRRAQRVFVNREAYRLNPADHNALEAALAASGDGHAMTVIGYGGAPVQDVLRDALAAGAQRALWVQAPALQQAEASVLTEVLRCALAYLGGAGLVLLGADVLDADLAQLGPRLAQASEAAFAGDVYAVRVAAGDSVQAVVRGPDGYRWVAAEGPVVATVVRDCNQPRFAPAARIITIYSTPDAVEALTLEALGLSKAALKPLTERRGESFPPERELGGLADGSEAETARRVAAELAQ
jgi:electron transfer flavoprotein beta subunit